ncbi:uncharacterized protein SOCE26_018580 [Sorangium cellulosum]|uniref:Fungal lipase-type domain-containing protein n=1 Tax=Sorangium cellulosum TaxID=56 RepID=A0A2L0EMD1_SORCE|nr:hypothetical protein [Sorangium cellulosum]AUX40457.1 uncharacterized protein SOCE26_018580 [Sorangium cellulosum]
MKNERSWSGDGLPNHAVDARVADTFQRAISLFPEEWAAAAARKRTVDVVNELANVSEGAYNHNAASLLAAASAWAYSDNEEVARMMEKRGFSNVCVTFAFENQGLLMDSLAHVIQSRDGRVVILSFRGSQLHPVINWLANINIKPDPFHAAGRVHGSFYTGILSVWPRVREHLLGAKNGESVCRVWQRTAPSKFCDPDFVWGDTPGTCGEVPSLREQDPRRVHRAKLRSVVGALEEALRFKLEALYITGHSLGGALAVLAAALIYSDEELKELRPLLRGIYTFGQPMVGDRAFAKTFERQFGSKLFRHIYNRDVVPHMPPRSAGRFEHFGQEYRSTPAGWISNGRPIARQVRFAIPALAGSLASWFADQFPIGPLLPDGRSWSWVKRRLLPPILRKPHEFLYSMTDHLPIHYLRASRTVLPGSEFL